MSGFLSVAVITKNEAHRIERCLRSVAFADQVVVVDSGSSDESAARPTPARLARVRNSRRLSCEAMFW